MGQFQIYRDFPGVTLVSDLFIDRYMAEANDAQIKIYLYLLRTGAQGSLSVADLADKFNYTEKDVIRALSYWDKKGVLKLSRGEDGSLSGVALLSLQEEAQSPAKNPEPVRDALPVQKKASLHEEASPSENEKTFSKPDYSASDVHGFRDQADTAELICVVEQYLNKTLTPSEIRTLMFFKDEKNGLGFSNELIDYLFDYCLTRDKKSFRYIETVAVKWAEDGIRTPKEAAESAGLYNKDVYDVMRSLGKTSQPTRTEIGYVTRWTKDLDFPMEIIFEACERTVKGTDTHRFQYADRILTAWHEKNVRTRADIEALDRARKNDSSASSSTSSSDKPAGGTPQYKQFGQRKYDFNKLEKELLGN